MFSHLEHASGIPSVLFAITTVKENGKPNVCFHGWSCFSGDSKRYYTFLPGLYHGGHTYQNIQRTGEFVINFISKAYFDACCATTQRNEADTDEIEAGGFTAESSVSVACPRLQEAFVCLECTLDQVVPLHAEGSLVIGRVLHMAAEESHSKGLDAKYGPDGFMLHIHEPRDLTTGEGKPSALAVCDVARMIGEG